VKEINAPVFKRYPPHGSLLIFLTEEPFAPLLDDKVSEVGRVINSSRDGKGFMQIAVIINAQLLFAGADFDPGAALLRIKAIAR